jgi:hypothetical protein
MAWPRFWRAWRAVLEGKSGAPVQPASLARVPGPGPPHPPPPVPLPPPGRVGMSHQRAAVIQLSVMGLCHNHWMTMRRALGPATAVLLPVGRVAHVSFRPILHGSSLHRRSKDGQGLRDCTQPVRRLCSPLPAPTLPVLPLEHRLPA